MEGRTAVAACDPLRAALVTPSSSAARWKSRSLSQRLGAGWQPKPSSSVPRCEGHAGATWRCQVRVGQWLKLECPRPRARRCTRLGWVDARCCRRRRLPAPVRPHLSPSQHPCYPVPSAAGPSPWRQQQRQAAAPRHGRLWATPPPRLRTCSARRPGPTTTSCRFTSSTSSGAAWACACSALATAACLQRSAATTRAAAGRCRRCGGVAVGRCVGPATAAGCCQWRAPRPCWCATLPALRPARPPLRRAGLTLLRTRCAPRCASCMRRLVSPPAASWPRCALLAATGVPGWAAGRGVGRGEALQPLPALPLPPCFAHRLAASPCPPP